MNSYSKSYDPKSITGSEVKSYAVKRVNPFIGVYQIIETSGGRAISSNGIVWEIELRTERSGMWGSLNINKKEAVYYRFGLWSKDDGLVNRPLAPHLDRDPLTLQCNILIACIEESLAQLPFEIVDNHELWLFDSKNHNPLALLASHMDGAKPALPEAKFWKACLGANGVQSQHRYPFTRELEQLVEQAASTNITKHWVKRLDDNSGIYFTRGEEVKINKLPCYGLTENWSCKEDALLVKNYIDWIAPSLLTLQNLTTRQRDYLENCLHVQAISVEHHWHLYPVLLNEAKIKAARVQCQLQKING